MRRHRVITTAALLALALALPATAHAGSLLSGYGGPGQGNQAILGATVIGGAAGGGSAGGGSSSSGGESPAPVPTSAASPAPSTPSPRGSAHHPGKAKTRQGHASVSPSGAHGAASTLSLKDTASVATPALGISGTDLLYVLLALGALILTAAITGWLVRRPGQDGQSAKGIRRRTRVVN
jgi:hypothetical protein